MLNIYWFDQPACQDPLLVGGKAANLGRLAARHPVPPGFCLAAGQVLSDGTRVEALAEDVALAYGRLGEKCGLPAPSVAVRSSAVDEDGNAASFAGQHESFLNIIGAEAVTDAVLRCLESAHTKRAQYYRQAHGLTPASGIAVLVQQLVMADVSAVVFSADPRSGARDRVVINATWGLGESLVGGTVMPDLYVVQKADYVVCTRDIADKQWMTVAQPQGTREVGVPRSLRREAALSTAQVQTLTRLALTLEQSQGWPVDLECAFQRGQLYLLQCRPITTLPGGSHAQAA